MERKAAIIEKDVTIALSSPELIASVMTTTPIKNYRNVEHFDSDAKSEEPQISKKETKTSVKKIRLKSTSSKILNAGDTASKHLRADNTDNSTQTGAHRVDTLSANPIRIIESIEQFDMKKELDVASLKEDESKKLNKVSRTTPESSYKSCVELLGRTVNCSIENFVISDTLTLAVQTWMHEALTVEGNGSEVLDKVMTVLRCISKLVEFERTSTTPNSKVKLL